MDVDDDENEVIIRSIIVEEIMNGDNGSRNRYISLFN